MSLTSISHPQEQQLFTLDARSNLVDAGRERLGRGN